MEFVRGRKLPRTRRTVEDACPYKKINCVRGAGRVIEFKFCCTHSVGKNPLLGESYVPLWHPICTENPCVR